MMDKELLGVIGLVVGLVGYGFYLQGILKGHVKPHGFTWLVWGVLTIIAVVAQVIEKAGPGTWVLGMAATACFLFSAIGFLQKEKDITRSDIVSLVFAIGSIPVWILTKNPLWAVVMVSAIDAIGAFPTIRKSWNKPYTENISAFVISGFSMIIGIAALDVYNVITVLYLATVASVNCVIVASLVYRRRTAT